MVELYHSTLMKQHNTDDFIPYINYHVTFMLDLENCIPRGLVVMECFQEPQV